eukprot:109969-Rhodomonas_salina.1
MKRGEEILVFYSSQKGQEITERCHCGAPNCPGTVGAAAAGAVYDPAVVDDASSVPRVTMPP